MLPSTSSESPRLVVRLEPLFVTSDGATVGGTVYYIDAPTRPSIFAPWCTKCVRRDGFRNSSAGPSPACNSENAQCRVRAESISD